MENIIKNNPELAENSDRDNNNIMLILMISYFFKTFELIVIILTVSYFMGMFWYIFCDITYDPYTTDEDLGFKGHFNLDDFSSNQNAVKVTYFSFTTLSTVGFGDFNPRSNSERLFCAIILLVGVAIFSYIM